MTYKQQLFVDAYLLNGGNASKAFIAAGFSSKHVDSNAYKLLQNAEVKQAIHYAQLQTQERATKSKADLIAYLEDIVEVYKISGKLTTNALKAIDQLAKMQGFNEPDRQEITIKPATINIIKPGSIDNSNE